MCVVLQELASAVEQVQSLAHPHGPGADQVLGEQVAALRAAVVVLQRELAVRGAALEKASPVPLDVRGDARRAGMAAAQAAALRRLGVFLARHRALADAWTTGELGQDVVDAVRVGAVQLRREDLARQLVEVVLPVLPGLSVPQARTLIAATVDQLAPGIPDDREAAEHAARALCWAQTPGGGITLTGYLPAPEADAFTRAIEAMDTLRATGDTLTSPQRRADALTALITTSHPPAAGGLPAALTLTVSLTEALRIAYRDPRDIATRRHRRPHGDAHLATTSHGNVPAADATVRFGLCCAAVTPILHTTPATPPTPAQPGTAPPTADTADTTGPPGTAENTVTASAPPPDSALAILAATPTQPLAVGRAARLATPAQRQALRLRDHGCVIPDCGVDAAHTQPHHVQPWNLAGPTNLDNLVSLCWIHHRQTELGRWTFHPKNHQPKPPHAHEHAHWWITPPGPTTPTPPDKPADHATA